MADMNEKIETVLPLPCPFCGAEMVLQGDYTLEAAWNFYAHKDLIDSECFLAEHKVYCGSDYTTPKPDALRIWNKRAALPPLRAREEIAGDETRECLRELARFSSLPKDHPLVARVEAALSRTAGQEWREPEGWQLVPKVPDIRMLQAGYVAFMKAYKRQVYGEAIFDRAYRAAIASAPPPPVAEATVAETRTKENPT